MEITTPGLLFPAISLLMLAYTNRFLGLANLMRQLILKFQDQKKESDWKQIENLRFRISLLRYIQALGVLSLLLCTLTCCLSMTGIRVLTYGKARSVVSIVLRLYC